MRRARPRPRSGPEEVEEGPEVRSEESEAEVKTRGGRGEAKDEEVKVKRARD